MAESGNNGILYAIIGALGVAVVGGTYYIFGSNLHTPEAKVAVAPVATPAPVAPATSPQPPSTDPERNALAASIDRTITTGDFANADRLLADANQRYSGNATWPPLQQRLAKARADREVQLRQTEARRLIAEARRFAQVDDFSDAESMLQAAATQAPGLPEIAQARSDIAFLRTERGDRYRERYQYEAAVDQALAADRFWEAERLLADYAQRFGADNGYRARNERLMQMRNAATWQARVNQARAHIAAARQAMDRGDFADAERRLAVADSSAPGFPETNTARADLSRRRIAAEKQQDEIALILRAIDLAFQARHYDDADRAIDDGRRRFGTYAGWADLQRRAADVRQGNDRQAEELRAKKERALALAVTARRSAAQGDFATADRSLTEASGLAPNLPEIAIARAELERAKADRARLDAEARAVAASADAALARKQYADAERLIGDGTKRYPGFAGWAELSRKLADERRLTPAQTGNVPMPAAPQPTQMPPAAPNTATAAPPVAAMPNSVTAPPINPRMTELVAAAREAIKRSDFPAAERSLTEANGLSLNMPEIAAARAELERAKAERARQEAEARALAASADAAIARKQYVDAERLIGDGAKRYPGFAGWADLSRKLADERRTAPVQTGNAPQAQVPQQPPQPPPQALIPPASARPSAPTPNTPVAPAANPRVAELVAVARDAVKRSDLAVAEKAAADAEKLDPTAAAVTALRVELESAKADRARQEAEARAVAASVDAALARMQFGEAERLIGDGSKRYPTFAGWSDLSRKLVLQRRVAELVSAGRDAIKRSDFAAAEKSVAEAEKLDAKAAAVIEVRAELKTAAAAPARATVLPSSPRTVELVAVAREAIKGADFSAAEKAVAEAEKLDSKATIVIEVRAELKAIEDKVKDNDKVRPQQRGNRN